MSACGNAVIFDREDAMGSPLTKLCNLLHNWQILYCCAEGPTVKCMCLVHACFWLPYFTLGCSSYRALFISSSRVNVTHQVINPTKRYYVGSILFFINSSYKLLNFCTFLSWLLNLFQIISSCVLHEMFVHSGCCWGTTCTLLSHITHLHHYRPFSCKIRNGITRLKLSTSLPMLGYGICAIKFLIFKWCWCI